MTTDDFEQGPVAPQVPDPATYITYAESQAALPVVRPGIGVAGSRGLDLSAAAPPSYNYLQLARDYRSSPGPITVSAALRVVATGPGPARAQVGLHDAPHQQFQNTDGLLMSPVFGEVAAIAVNNAGPVGTRGIQYIQNDAVLQTDPFEAPLDQFHTYSINYTAGGMVQYLVDGAVRLAVPAVPVQSTMAEAVSFAATLRGLGTGAVADDFGVCDSPTLAAPGDLTYQPAVDFPVGTGPVRLVSGDFDEDGDLDLATADQAGASVSVYMGDGLGGFSPGSTNINLGAVYDLEVGDVNRDGRLDLVTINPNELHVLIGDGFGTFSPIGPFLQDSSGGIVLADFDKDGAPEIALALADRLLHFRDDGNGGFASSGGISVPLGGTILEVVLKSGNFDQVPRAIALVDTGTGKAVVVTQFDPDPMSLAFSPLRTIPAVDSTTLIAADLDGNYHEDFVTHDPTSQAFRISFNRGQTSLDDYKYGTDVSGAVRLAVADIDRDGLPDLLSTDTSGGGEVVVHLTRERGESRGDARHGFREVLRYTLAADPSDLEVADFDRDGVLDLAATSFTGNVITIRRGGLVPNLERGIFSIVATLATGGTAEQIVAGETEFNAATGFEDLLWTLAGSPFQVVKLSFPRKTVTPFVTSENAASLLDLDIAHIDFDGVLDLVIANMPSSKILYPDPDNFAATTEGSTSEPAETQTLADFDGDGFIDLVGVDGTTLYFQLADRLGAFTSPRNVILNAAPGNTFSDLDHGDFNGDGREDFVVLRTSGGPPSTVLEYWFNDGDGGFNFDSDVAVRSGPTSLAVGDFDRDGDPDVAITISTNSSVQIVLTSEVPTAVDQPIPAPAFDVEAADVNSDAILDLVTLSQAPCAAVISLGDGMGGFTVAQQLAIPGGVPQDAITLDHDGNGTTDAGVVSTTSDQVDILTNQRDSTSQEAKGP